MTRFFAVASLRRGVIDPPELLDATGQSLAYARLRHDMSVLARAAWELELSEDKQLAALRDCAVVWSEKPVQRAPTSRVEKMLALAGKVG